MRRESHELLRCILKSNQHSICLVDVAKLAGRQCNLSFPTVCLVWLDACGCADTSHEIRPGCRLRNVSSCCLWLRNTSQHTTTCKIDDTRDAICDSIDFLMTIGCHEVVIQTSASVLAGLISNSYMRLHFLILTATWLRLAFANTPESDSHIVRWAALPFGNRTEGTLVGDSYAGHITGETCSRRMPRLEFR